MTIFRLIQKISKNSRYKAVLEVIVFLIISFAFVYVFSAFVPYEFDEFAQYHTLGCHYYPHNMLNTFRASCQAWRLAPFGEYFLPLRSGAPYDGAAPCLIYFPLFLLWPAPISARFLGVLLFGIQAFCIRRLFKIDFLVAFVLILFFLPYVFIHIYASALVHLQTTSVFLIYYFLQRWGAALGNDFTHSWRFPVYIGFILFLGIWTKLTYFAVVPGIALFMIYYFVKHRDVFWRQGVKRKFAAHLILLIVVASSLIFILLNSKTQQGWTYYHQVISPEKPLSFKDPALVKEKVVKLGKYFANPLQAANLTFRVREKATSTGISYMATLILFFVFGTGWLVATRRRADYAFMNMFLAVLTFLILTFIYQRSGQMHHVVLCFPFILLSLFYLGSQLYRNKVIFVLMAIFLLISVKLYVNLSNLAPQFYNPLTKIRYLDTINEKFAEGYVYIVNGFGHYFIKQLYGPKDQCVLYLDGHYYSADNIATLKRILGQLDRKALFICTRLSPFLKEHFPDLIEHTFDFDTHGWQVWYQP